MRPAHHPPSEAFTVVSLTEPGRALAERLLAHWPDAEHLYRPQPFQEAVQTRFQQGRRLILLCAAGIAVRTLAPALRDKYRDPAVLVMDEHGRFVVPILSGHEGGANEWARQIGQALGAQCVITGAQRYTQPLLVAGLGCNRGCPLERLLSLLDQTLNAHGLRREDLSALASIELKRDEPAMHQLAAALAVPIQFYPASILAAYGDRLSQKSEIVFRETGCHGVAEAAALAHAERLIEHPFPAELIIPKQKNPDATLAVARIYGNRD
ncbi:MAG TPA: cobalamin biosynthesis protein [Candidatus Competibacter sp.]|nr:cobalamin biosynthesis protein CbiG [Candidatus Competibacteraceae bacterium]HRE54087.1 cobalamin biosynthesis protein [Candidatus Competibacter sp.]HUM95491.1 cobalamin biosynthesis protein [Candidatus Competibacter sp.]